MANVRILDNKLILGPAADKILTPQTMYELTIPAGTFTSNSRLKISATLGRRLNLGDECIDTVENCVSTCLTRTVPNACLTEYMYDCYDAGSLIWTTNPWVLAKDPVFGCTDCPRTNGATEASSATAISGTEGQGTGGFTMLVAEESPICGDINNYQSLEFFLNGFNLFTEIIGEPIYGYAVNVLASSTPADFTGLVLLFNHKTNLLILGQYNNANLSNGDLPVTLDSVALGTIPQNAVEMVIVNGLPSGGQQTLFVSVQDESTELATFDMTTTVPDPASIPMGMGFFWVGNSDPGTHSVKWHWLSGNDTQALVWHNGL